MIYCAKISKKDKMEVIVRESKEELLKYIKKWYNTWYIDYIIKGEYEVLECVEK